MKHAIRRLLRTPGFTALSVVTLAIGIGATTAVFSVVDNVLIKPLPYPDADALVFFGQTGVDINAPGEMPTSATQVITYREQNRSFTELGAWTTGTATVTGTGEPQELRRLIVSQGALDALGVQPALGRWFSQQDDTPGTPETVVLFHDYWQSRYAGDPSILGRTVELDTRPREVIGIMPRGFRFLQVEADLITPMRWNRDTLRLGQFNYSVLGRLRPGTTIEQASADVARLIPGWIAAWPEPAPGMRKMIENARIAPALRPLKEEVVGDVDAVLWLVMGTIGVVLVIACANVANLLLVRVEGRQQELAIRSALGAGRGRIARDLLIESIVLGAFAGALGVVLAFAALQVLVAIAPATLPRLGEIAVDLRVLLFAIVMTLAASVAFALLPIARAAGRQIAGGLRGSDRTISATRERHRARNSLVVAEVALSLVLLVSSGLMIRTFMAMRSVHPGFTQPEQLQLIRVGIGGAQIREPAQVLHALSRIRDRLSSIAGVTAVSFASSAPMEDAFDSHDALRAQDRTYAEGQIPPVRRFEFVAPGYFAATGTPIVSGRDITWIDIHNGLPVVMVSEKLARDTWGEPSAAVGKRLQEFPSSPWREVVGVVGNIYEDGVHEQPSATAYWPVFMEQFWDNRVFVRRSVAFTIRSSRTGNEAFLNEVRRAVWEVVPNVPVAQVRTLQDLYDRSMARTSFTLVMLAIAAGMALLLGVVGIYGVLAYAVTQRTREIGIRAALGAPQAELKRLFVRDGLVLTTLGIGLGIPAAVAVTRLMSGMLFGVTPVDPATYVGVSALLAMAAAVASYIPARRASRVDPIVALRYE